MTTLKVRGIRESAHSAAANTVSLAASDTPSSANLSNAQVGNGQSTNTADRGVFAGSALLKVTTTVGATPTVTVAVEGSPDGTNWFNIPYADSATPTTVTVATFVITTATTLWKIIQVGVPVRYVRLTYTANTNVTITADLWAFEG